MLVDKTVKVEREVDDLVSQLVLVVSKLKAGQPVTDVLLAELLKLQQLVSDVQALPTDYQESFLGTVKAIACGAADLAAALLGKDAQPL